MTQWQGQGELVALEKSNKEEGFILRFGLGLACGKLQPTYPNGPSCNRNDWYLNFRRRPDATQADTPEI